jgi:hypothetical protein
MKAYISVHRTKMVPERSRGIYYKASMKQISPLTLLGQDDKLNVSYWLVRMCKY